MPTLEERVQALEQEITARKRTEETLIQEIAARKQAEEMLTIAVRALVSKEAFEKLQETLQESQEQNGKLFNVIINQNALHNERLGDLQGQIIDLNSKLDGKVTVLDSKITGLDNRVTEMQTTVTGLDNRVMELQTTVTGLQTEMRQGFTGIETALTQILGRLPEKP